MRHTTPQSGTYAPLKRPTLGQYVLELKQSGRLTKAVEEAAEKAEAVRSTHHTVVYLAGPLTGVSEELKHRYVQLSELVASFDGMFGYAPHLHGTDPVKHPNVTPDEVRDIDFMFAVVVPDYHINCMHPLGHGNAIEEGWAELAGVPALYLAPSGLLLSRLVRGMRNIAGTVTYDDFTADALPKVGEFLRSLRAN